MAVEAEEAEAVVVRIVEAEEVVRIAGVEEVRTVEKVKARRARPGRSTRGTRRPGTRTCRHSSPAPVTGSSGRLHISVKSQVLAHGRISGYLKAIAINEIQADSKKF